MDLTTQTDYSDIAVVSVGGSVQDTRASDDPPLPPEPDDDEWSPSDGLSAQRRAIGEARAGIQAGKTRMAHRQAAIEQRRTRHQGNK